MDPDLARAATSASDPAQNSGVPPAVDLEAWVGRWRARQGAEARAGVPTAASLEPAPRQPDQAARRLERAARYLERVPPAVSGEHGHDRTFEAACILVKGFAFSIDEARPLLRAWNQRCVPPWSEKDLEHKLKDADARPDGKPRGYLLQNSQSRGRKTKRPPSSQAGRPAATAPEADQPAATASEAAADLCPEGQEANPHRLARRFLSGDFSAAGETHLRFWREEFHGWDGSAYRRVPVGEIRARLSYWLAEEFDRLYELEKARLLEGEDGFGRGSRRVPRPMAVTSGLVTDVLQAMSGLVLIPAQECPVQPAWIDVAAEADAADAPPCWPVDEVLPTRNVLVHLPSLVDGEHAVMPPTPRFFNAFALDYEFVPTAPEPAEWIDFLRQIWEDDEESIACLQEWFGYLLTPDTRQQKILMMVGPKRSGRGTIARVLKALVGPNNVVNPTLSTLARPFGLAPLIDKPVAIFPDARLSSRPDNAAITESLLSISGEDDQTVDRKHLPAWTGRLPTRFVLISNELPRLRDASGALASRLILLRFTRSFYGREDVGLYERLSRELPGILLWAIAGWRRLRARGWFVQPRSGRDLLAAMEDLASPISAFLRDRCVLERGSFVPAPALYEAWRSWCQEHGREMVGDEAAFGRDLHAAIPGLAKSRLRIDSVRVFHYMNIRLRTALDPDPESDFTDPAVPLPPSDEQEATPF